MGGGLDGIVSLGIKWEEFVDTTNGTSSRTNPPSMPGPTTFGSFVGVRTTARLHPLRVMAWKKRMVGMARSEVTIQKL